MLYLTEILTSPPPTFFGYFRQGLAVTTQITTITTASYLETAKYFGIAAATVMVVITIILFILLCVGWTGGGTWGQKVERAPGRMGDWLVWVFTEECCQLGQKMKWVVMEEIPGGVKVGAEEVGGQERLQGGMLSTEQMRVQVMVKGGQGSSGGRGGNEPTAGESAGLGGELDIIRESTIRQRRLTVFDEQ
ncbi:hypothetical protein HDV00_010060 [Rhizophlyctis rosea]|nr:hypothetical protein HDV00_010060 [Rhizophlyctis rosea]